MKRVEKVKENHKKGYNCAQAVACAYADLLGADEETIYKIAEGFGSGMGGLMHTCGAVSAACMVAGLKNSNGELGNRETRLDTYGKIKEIAAKFEEKNGSIVCRELKGIDTKKMLRSCPGCVEDAALILEEVLKETKDL